MTTAEHAPRSETHFAEERGAPVKTSARSAGVRVGSLVIGTALVAVGVPMLVLPGPGIAAIAGGGVLIARGLRGKKGR